MKNGLTLAKMMAAREILMKPSGWEVRRMGMSIQERERTQALLDSRGRLVMPVADGQPRR